MKLDKGNKKIDKLTKENQKLKDENKILRKENKVLKNKIANLETRFEKDSSNSSKPSSTNGYKKVITNRREKSNKNKGGQPGHQFFSLNKEKVKGLKENWLLVEIYDVYKTINNWVEKLGKKLEPELEKIEESLLDSYYINADESNISKMHGSHSKKYS